MNDGDQGEHLDRYCGYYSNKARLAPATDESGQPRADPGCDVTSHYARIRKLLALSHLVEQKNANARRPDAMWGRLGGLTSTFTQ